MKVLITVFVLASLISFFCMIFLDNNFLERIGYAAIGMLLLFDATVLKSADSEAIPRNQRKSKRIRRNDPKEIALNFF